MSNTAPEIKSETTAALDAAYDQAVARERHTVWWRIIRFRLRDWINKELQQPEAYIGRDMVPLLSLLGWVKRQHRLVHLSAIGLIGLMLATIGILWMLPHTVDVSFAHERSCSSAPTFFPGVYTSDPHSVFRIERPASFTILGIHIFSASVCAVPVAAPRTNEAYTSRQFIRLLGWDIPVSMHIHTGAYATAKAAASTLASLPLAIPLQFTLSHADAVFTYRVAVAGHTAPCAKQATALSCSLRPLQLAYDTSYSLQLERGFQGTTPSTVMTVSVTTITAVAITSTSIGAGSVVYDIPQSLTLTTNKPLASISPVVMHATVNNQESVVAVKAHVSGNGITVTFAAALPRRAQIDLSIAQVTARDGSQLEEPYTLAFTTSGGPKVTGTNIGSSGVSLRPAIYIYFDQPLSPGQSAQGLVTLASNGTAVPTTTVLNGSYLAVTSAADLPRCAIITIQTAGTATSQYGFSGDSTWTFRSRTLCYTTFSIGTSVRGRALTAYQFGGGGNLVLYIAAMHGNESNTAWLLQDWIGELDAHPDSIPAGRTIVVIPEINPDGVAANTRVNADGIDLNRNFPTADWQTQVTEPTSNGALTNDGGPSPLSEPESQAVAAYVQAQHPRLVLTYHSHAGVVEANDAADADQLGQQYAAKSGYSAIPTYAIGATFDYSTSGALEDWMREKFNWPALVIELWTSYSEEFYTNRSAMWAMAQIQ